MPRYGLRFFKDKVKMGDRSSTLDGGHFLDDEKSISYVPILLSLLMIVAGAVWAIRDVQADTERRFKDAFDVVENRAFLARGQLVRKDQFEEFKDGFQRMQEDVEVVKRELSDLRADIRILTATIQAQQSVIPVSKE